jgi:hypothetical protein
MAVNPDTGELLTETGDDYGPFSFKRDEVLWSQEQEEEGIDYLDMFGKVDMFGKGYPGAGEVHAILNFNAMPWTDNCQEGNVSIKHYTAWPERYCKTTPGNDEVTLWEKANFKGTCRTLVVGDYPGDRWTYPVSKGSLSIRVGAGVKAIVFSGDQDSGVQRTVRGDTIDPCDPADDSQSKGQISNWAACGWWNPFGFGPFVWSLQVAPLP